MDERCRHCGLVFERIEGHWIGAIGLNTIGSFGMLLVSMTVGFMMTLPDVPVLPLMIGNGIVAVIAPILLFPFSRTIWTAIDIAMRPLEPHEVDWTAIPDRPHTTR